MNIIFELLNRNGLIKRNKVQSKTFENIKFSKLIDTVNEITYETSLSVDSKNNNIFSNTASIGLSGGRGDCVALECRLRKSNQLAKFVTLFSDKVYTYNFLSEHSTDYKNVEQFDSMETRKDIYEDIIVLNSLSPLIKEGLVVPFNPIINFCPVCTAKKVFGKKGDKKVRNVEKKLIETFSNLFNITFFNDEYNNYSAEILTSEEIYEHGSHYCWMEEDALVENFSQFPGLIDKLYNGKKVTLGKRQKKYFTEQAAHDMLKSLIYQMSVSEIYDTSLLTHREFDSQILDMFDTKQANSSKITPSDLEVMLPFIDNIPINKILKIRNREQESLILFRNAIKKASDEVYKNKRSSKKIAYEIRDDIIIPELARLKIKVNKAKRDLIKQPLTSTISVASVLSFGFYSGLINNVESAASALGIGKVLYDSVKSGMESLDTQKDIRTDKFYFLWKLHNMSKPRIGKDIII